MTNRSAFFAAGPEGGVNEASDHGIGRVVLFNWARSRVGSQPLVLYFCRRSARWNRSHLLNPNAATPSVMCVAFNAPPSSNGLGTDSNAGFALSPVAAGKAQYAGYFNFNQSLTVEIVAGVNGEADSPVVTYDQTVPMQAILPSSFGWQCGFGNSDNCPIVGGALTWPTSSAMPSTASARLRL